MGISAIQDIIADIKAGQMVVLVDAEDRENEGDLVMAADCVTPEAINFMAKHARGLICLTLTEEHCQQLHLPLMVAQNRAAHGTNFTVSIEASKGVTTGISAADRARTIQVAVAPAAKPEDLVQPGHIFPLQARAGGVLVRAGHTEAGCDLALLAGKMPAAVICEIMNDDGSMARLPELMSFAKQHRLKVGTIADLIHYRSRTESLIKELGRRVVKTPFGEFTLVVFHEVLTTATHIALLAGEVYPDQETLVRVHEPLSVIDFLAPSLLGHTWSLPQALATIHEKGQGVVVLLHCNENGKTLLNDVLRVADEATKRWDGKTFGIGAQILRHLGVGKMRLMASSGNFPSMTGFDLEITGICLPSERPIDDA